MSKTEHPMLDDTELEAFFAAARAETVEPSPALMARIVADAEAEAEARDAAARQRTAARAPRRGVIAAVIAGLGGWTAVAGMVTATVAGVWFGFAAPDEVNTLAGGLLWPDGTGSSMSYDLEDILPGGGTGLVTIFEEEGT